MRTLGHACLGDVARAESVHLERPLDLRLARVDGSERRTVDDRVRPRERDALEYCVAIGDVEIGRGERMHFVMTAAFEELGDLTADHSAGTGNDDSHAKAPRDSSCRQGGVL